MLVIDLWPCLQCMFIIFIWPLSPPIRSTPRTLVCFSPACNFLSFHKSFQVCPLLNNSALIILPLLNSPHRSGVSTSVSWTANEFVLLIILWWSLGWEIWSVKHSLILGRSRQTSSTHSITQSPHMINPASACLSVSVCLSVPTVTDCLAIYPSICLAVCVYPSICWSVPPSFCLWLKHMHSNIPYLWAHLSICWLIQLSIYLSVGWSVKHMHSFAKVLLIGLQRNLDLHVSLALRWPLKSRSSALNCSLPPAVQENDFLFISCSSLDSFMLQSCSNMFCWQRWSAVTARSFIEGF